MAKTIHFATTHCSVSPKHFTVVYSFCCRFLLGRLLPSLSAPRSPHPLLLSASFSTSFFPPFSPRPSLLPLIERSRPLQSELLPFQSVCKQRNVYRLTAAAANCVHAALISPSGTVTDYFLRVACRPPLPDPHPSHDKLARELNWPHLCSPTSRPRPATQTRTEPHAVPKGLRPAAAGTGAPSSHPCRSPSHLPSHLPDHLPRHFPRQRRTTERKKAGVHALARKGMLRASSLRVHMYIHIIIYIYIYIIKEGHYIIIQEWHVEGVRAAGHRIRTHYYIILILLYMCTLLLYMYAYYYAYYYTCGYH